MLHAQIQAKAARSSALCTAYDITFFAKFQEHLFLFGIGCVPVSALSECDRPVSSRLLLTLHGRPSSPARHPVMGAPLFFPLIVGAQCCANHTHLCKHLGKVDLVEAAPFLQPERHRSGRHVAGIWTQGLRHRPRQHLKERIILPQIIRCIVNRPIDAIIEHSCAPRMVPDKAQGTGQALDPIVRARQNAIILDLQVALDIREDVARNGIVPIERGAVDSRPAAQLRHRDFIDRLLLHHLNQMLAEQALCHACALVFHGYSLSQISIPLV